MEFLVFYRIFKGGVAAAWGGNDLDEIQSVIIIEIKQTEKFYQMEDGCAKALEQIKRQDYAAGVLDEGYENILEYGICFCKKSCVVKGRKCQWEFVRGL